MTDDEALARLCELAGILSAYRDNFGRRHALSSDTARGILNALGIACMSSAEVRASLAGLEEEPWRAALPPVVVIREAESGSSDLHLPAGLPRTAVKATVHCEDGTERSLPLDPAALPLLGVRAVDGVTVERRILALPALPIGYHRLVLSGPSWESAAVLIVAPKQCYLPPEVSDDRRIWGLAAQLYALRNAHNSGIGEFTDLGDLLEMAKDLGAEAVGINPLHALFPENPAHASPYSPSSRQFLNPLYLDVTATPDFSESEAAQKQYETQSLDPMGSATHVDYPSVAAFKQKIFTALYENFAVTHMSADDARAHDYRAFVARGGQALERFALHAALCEHFGAGDGHAWPTSYRDPTSSQCAAFAREHAARINYHLYLQWQCEKQLRDASSRGVGLGVGVYGDLAIGSAPGGADVWGAPDIYAGGARVGAPPDAFNEAGQEWGVVPMHPMRMRKAGYANFSSLLRANMRHFGALRIDHAMGLERLFWIPEGMPPSTGAYLKYPREDLLGVLALESHRHRCLVIGEDLGTVPHGFRDRLAATNVLSYRVLYFEQLDGAFNPPECYPRLSAICVSTHDLPTLRGYWEERDLRMRSDAGLFASKAELDQARKARLAEKRALLVALEEAGLLPVGMAAGGEDFPILTPELAAAIHQYLACSPARLFMVQMDDLAGETAQANMPGTSDGYANWRRRIKVPMSDVAHGAFGTAVLDVVRMERPKRR